MRTHRYALIIALWFCGSAAHAAATKVTVQPLDNETSLPAAELTFLGDVIRAGLTEASLGKIEIVTNGAADYEIRGRAVSFSGGLVAVLEVRRNNDSAILWSVTTPRCQDSGALLTALKSEAGQLGARLPSLSSGTRLDARIPPPQSALPQTGPQTRPSRPAPILTGPSRLKVRTDPPGATVSLSKEPQGSQKILGPTPVDASLEPGRYYMDIELKNHHRATRDLDLMPGRTHEYDYQLGSKAPLHTVAIAGHALLWPGLAVAAIGGFVTIGHENLTPLWIGLGAGGALAVTGLVLLAVAPARQEKIAPTSQIMVAPLPSGGATVGYSSHF